MQRKPPRRTRERILERALRMFNDLGEPNVTTTAIADELEISPGNLYYHFRNKDDIVNGLLERFAQDVDGLLTTPGEREVHVDDVWMLLHLLFEAIWRYRFAYRDVNDLVTRNRRFESRFKGILERKARTLRAWCEALAAAGALRAEPSEIEALATNMVVISTYWLSYEYVLAARRFGDAGFQSRAIARGVYQVLSTLAPSLDDPSRALLRRLASEYVSG